MTPNSIHLDDTPSIAEPPLTPGGGPSPKRKLLSGFLWLSADRFVRIGVSMVVGLLVTRYLGPHQFGLFGYALALVAMAQPVAELGFDAIARREFAANPGNAAGIAGTVLAMRLIGSLCAIVGCSTIALFTSASSLELRMVLILSLTTLQPCASLPETWLQVNHHFGRTVRRQWLALALGSGLRLSGIFLHAPVEFFALLVVGEFAFGALLILRAAREHGFSLGPFDRPLAIRLLGQAWPLAAAGVASMIQMRIDMLLLHRLLGENDTGTYAAAVRLSEWPYILPSIAALSLQPLLTKAALGPQRDYQTKLQVYLDASTLAGYFIAIIATVSAPWLVVAAYGKPFAAAAPILAIHTWSTVFLFQGVVRNLFLVNQQLTLFELTVSLLGAALNIGLNILLIPRFHTVGAASAAVVAHAFASVMASFLHPACRGFARQQALALVWPRSGVHAALSLLRTPSRLWAK